MQFPPPTGPPAETSMARTKAQVKDRFLSTRTIGAPLPPPTAIALPRGRQTISGIATLHGLPVLFKPFVVDVLRPDHSAFAGRGCTMIVAARNSTGRLSPLGHGHIGWAEDALPIVSIGCTRPPGGTVRLVAQLIGHTDIVGQLVATGIRTAALDAVSAR